MDVFADLSLARRLERTEAVAGARLVEAHAAIRPDLDACWTVVAGTYAMYDGPKSPITQTFGLGLFEPPSHEQMDELEAFFRSRGAPVAHETCPIAGGDLLALLNQRGYTPAEWSSVLYLPMDTWHGAAAADAGAVRARLAGDDEHDVWVQTSVEGTGDVGEFTELLPELETATASSTDARVFLAELDGQPIAAAALVIQEGVALLAGAATIPRWRNLGAHRALFTLRLRHAQELGCDVAMMCAAEPGGVSQRNAERSGFRLAYTRTKWALVDE